VREGVTMAKQDGGGGGQELDFSTWVPSEQIPGTRYVVIELVDEGGHGRLYRVQHEITGRVCAFKAILRKFKSFGDLAARLKQEARINTSLSGHPNIAEVLDAGVTEDDRTYCVMQWLDGANLRNVLKNGTGLDVAWACFVVTSVLSALARAHRVDIVHRDIKPENIFLCDDGLVKLIDFGVAKVLNSKFIQTGRGMMPGTIRYMAPEALDGQTASRLSDIYSLGIVFWEVLAGEHPFPQPNQQAAAQAIVHHGVAPLDRSPIAVARSTPARYARSSCARVRSTPPSAFLRPKRSPKPLPSRWGTRPRRDHSPQVSTRPLTSAKCRRRRPGRGRVRRPLR
jgi:eukaryotic-like serine/threonine-protein kinase